MGLFRRTPSTDRERTSWSVPVLLLLIVALPTVCLLWFMTRAMDSERLAVRQRLDEAYRGQLDVLRDRLEVLWSKRIEALRASDREDGAPSRFAAVARERLADGAVLFDARGIPAYPGLSSGSGVDPDDSDPRWIRARRLEFEDRDPEGAAEAYAEMARSDEGTASAARALLARARCLAKTGDASGAVAILAETLAEPEYRGARDPSGRLIAPDASLRALELMDGSDHPLHDRVFETLSNRVRDYREPVLPARQRTFLLRALGERYGERKESGEPRFPLLEAEALSTAYVDRHANRFDSAFGSTFPLVGSWMTAAEQEEGPVLERCLMRGVWQLVLPGEGLVALFREEGLRGELDALGAGSSLSEAFAPSLIPPGEEARDPAGRALSLPSPRPLVGWRLVFDPTGEHIFEDSEDRAAAVYLWTGLLFTVALVGLVALVFRIVNRQMRIARLENDLVATVTHELKTPLASTRLLTDTLLAGRYRDPERTREYLELIARENARLGRLIENFLAFSRMKRDRRAFEPKPVAARSLVDEALDAVREKREEAGFTVTVEMEPGLPPVLADPDALVSVLVNLLENAFKYASGDPRVEVGARVEGPFVALSVRDYGEGLPARELKRIFDRFYQVDARLDRKGDGCGLGLAIVRFVIEAHGGEVEAAPAPGGGLLFMVRLPRAGEAPSPEDARAGSAGPRESREDPS